MYKFFNAKKYLEKHSEEELLNVADECLAERDLASAKYLYEQLQNSKDEKISKHAVGVLNTIKNNLFSQISDEDIKHTLAHSKLIRFS